MTKTHEEREQALRGELLKMKASARLVPLSEWIDAMLGIIEREKVQALEAYKERQYEAGISPRRILGASVVEVREGR